MEKDSIAIDNYKRAVGKEIQPRVYTFRIAELAEEWLLYTGNKAINKI